MSESTMCSIFKKPDHPSANEPSVTEVRDALDAMNPSLDDLFDRYETKRSALLPVLRQMQDEFGWLPPIVQREVAFRLKISPADVFRVVQFYTLFRGEPCGKNVIMVCGTISCEMAGANAVIKEICEKAGVDLNGTSHDGMFTVERVECLGWCDRAPVVQVNESDYYEKVTPASAAKLVEDLKGSK